MERSESNSQFTTDNIPNDNEALTKNFNNILKCRDAYLPLNQRTLIMGVLNITPDSFYDGGRYMSPDASLRQADRLVNEGADIIDVGGESTRPGSEAVSEEEELKRVMPVVREIKKRFDVVISIDTTKKKVAQEALQEGAQIVNDISGLRFGTGTAEAASEFGAGMVLMHTPSRPKDMQEHTRYVSLIDDIIHSLEISVRKAVEIGVDPKGIMIDPGFGFGKTAEQNLIILKHLDRFGSLGKPVLIGTSNKSFIGSATGSDIDSRSEGTAATLAIGILNGASVVRVHDVGKMKKVCLLADSVAHMN